MTMRGIVRYTEVSGSVVGGLASRCRLIVGSRPYRHQPRCRPGDRLLSGAGRWIVLWTIVFGLAGAQPEVAAQSLWEVTPYRVHVWIASEADPRIPADWPAQLATQLPRLAEARVGAPWTVTAGRTPASLTRDVLQHAMINYQTLIDVVDDLDNWDKLFCLVVRYADGGYRLEVRELDMASRQWSHPWTRQSVVADQLTAVAFKLLCSAFSPVVRIESVGEQTVVTSVRASGLVRPEQSDRRWKLPIEVNEGDVLQPLIRRSNRIGNVGPDGIEVIKWTVLIAEEKQGRQIRCRWQSGYRQPFRTRRSSRIEQLAVRIRPRFESTRLKLVDRRQKDVPLVGYEVHAKTSDEAPSRLVGRTNWLGEVVIPRDPEQLVQLIYVRNGKQLLAKLPIVPGDQAELVAPLRNDDLRLEAEGFLLGIQESLVDLVARREVLATRIRNHLAEDELDEAESLLKQLQRLDTQEDFARRVQQRKSSLTSIDAQVQQKVDELFAQTRTLLGKYLDRSQVEQLELALRQARQGSPQ